MTPSKILYKKNTARLVLSYADGQQAELSAEYLRVYSPSAEVKGHHPSQAVLQTGKKYVAIEQIQAVGNYAIQLFFSDGHHSGIYSWNYLWELHQNQANSWDAYLSKLQAQQASRDPQQQVVKLIDP